MSPSGLEPHAFPSPARRLFAAGIDLAFLWIITELLGVLYQTDFIAFGRSGRLIGALFFVAYIGGQNSKLGKAGTFGKRLLGLRVVDRSGKPIGLEKSFLRAALLLLPFLTRGVFAFPADPLVALGIHLVLVLTSAGYGLALLASYATARRGGQALHDRVLGTFVIEHRGTEVQPVPAPLPRWQRVATIVWLVACLLGGGAQWWLWGGSRWAQIVSLHERVSDLEGIQRAEVFVGTFYFRDRLGTKQATRYLEVRTVFDHRISDFSEQALHVADALSLPALGEQFDAVRITVGYEFDLMLASRRWQRSFVRTPGDWLDLLKSRPSGLAADTTPSRRALPH